MSKNNGDSQAISDQAERIYEEKIRLYVETEHRGEFLVLDVESQEYEIDADRHRALERAENLHKGGKFYILRIGFPAAVHLGGRLKVKRQ